MTAVQLTTLARYADELLGDDVSLVDFIASRRGEGKSWRAISRDLYRATGEKVDAAPETIRSWGLAA